MSEAVPEKKEREVKVEVENIGGIKKANIDFEEGVSLLTGANATNRTSFLQAVNAALGGEIATLRSTAEKGEVTMELDEKTYIRTVTENAHDGEIVTRYGGNPLCDDAELVDTFATLIETNPIRTCIRNEGDPERLRELLMGPVDDNAIQRQVDELQDEQNELETQERQLENKKGRLPKLEEKRHTLEQEIDDLQQEINEVTEDIEGIEVEEEETEEAKRVYKQLESKESRLSSVENSIERKQSKLESVKKDKEKKEEKLESVREELEELPEEDIEARRKELQNEAEEKEALSGKLGSAVALIDTILSNSEMRHELKQRDEDLTDAITEGDTLDCPACGNEANIDEFRERQTELQETVTELKSDVSSLRSEADDLRKKKKDREEKTDTVKRLETDVESLESRIEEYTEEIESLKEEKAELEEEVETLDAEAEELREAMESELKDLRDERRDLNRQLGAKQDKLENTKQEIDQIDEEVEQLDELEQSIEAVKAEKNELKDKIRDIEQEVINSFNRKSEEILELLGYENIDRVWIEGKSSPTSETNDRFHLEIVRGGGKGDKLSHLSESEREVIGIIVAVTGYMTHEVNNRVPFIIFDSLEAIDAERINLLIGEFSDVADFVMASLLPEDQAKVSGGYNRIPAEKLQSS